VQTARAHYLADRATCAIRTRVAVANVTPVTKPKTTTSSSQSKPVKAAKAVKATKGAKAAKAVIPAKVLRTLKLQYESDAVGLQSAETEYFWRLKHIGS
jgi:hypothetical protein